MAADRFGLNTSWTGSVRSRIGRYASILENGQPPSKEDVRVDPERLESFIATASDRASTLESIASDRTLDICGTIDEQVFYETAAGEETLATRYDLEKTVPDSLKPHLEEVDRYWVNKPHAFVSIIHARRENELKYYLVEPHLDEREAAVRAFLTEKLRATLGTDRASQAADRDERARVTKRAARRLLERFGFINVSGRRGELFEALDRLPSAPGVDLISWGRAGPASTSTEGRSDQQSSLPALHANGQDVPHLSEYQVQKLVYYLQRDFVGFGRIDGIKRDLNVEDISCDGYDSPVFIYHNEHETLITNVRHGRQELDDFVIKLAQRSGKAISKRQPQVDATLPDDSRAQLTLGREVSDHGTNYTIRQFRDVPFTPVDLINWGTYSIEQIADLWLAIENGKSMLFAGGTASGKTTALNALSLFVPSNAKIVSIEDTREVELPHRNWIASVTRPSLSTTDTGDIDEFDLLEAALRQRPDYIVMGEVRGEEGRTLFQITSTGHTTYTTFHAGSVTEVINRFTNAPIDVSKPLFTSLDLISVQAQTRVDGRKVRRNRSITEVVDYDADLDEIETEDIYQWHADADAFEKVAESTVLSAVADERGWTQAELERARVERRVVLAYLIDRGLTSYAEVAATVQAFIADPELILCLMADDSLDDHLGDLRRLETVDIDIDEVTDHHVPRPTPDDLTAERAAEILTTADEELFDSYRGEEFESILSGREADGGATTSPPGAPTR